MDPFVRRLVERLHHPTAPLTRNKHFHAFDNPLGREALKVSKRLRALQKDLLRHGTDGERPLARSTPAPSKGELKVEISFHWLKGTRTTLLERAEFELLCALPGVRALFD